MLPRRRRPYGRRADPEDSIVVHAFNFPNEQSPSAACAPSPTTISRFEPTTSAYARGHRPTSHQPTSAPAQQQQQSPTRISRFGSHRTRLFAGGSTGSHAADSAASNRKRAAGCARVASSGTRAGNRRAESATINVAGLLRLCSQALLDAADESGDDAEFESGSSSSDDDTSDVFSSSSECSDNESIASASTSPRSVRSRRKATRRERQKAPKAAKGGSTAGKKRSHRPSPSRAGSVEGNETAVSHRDCEAAAYPRSSSPPSRDNHAQQELPTSGTSADDDDDADVMIGFLESAHPSQLIAISGGDGTGRGCSPHHQDNTARKPELRLLPPPRGQPRLTVVLDLDETLVRLREGPVYVRPYAKMLFETLKQLPSIEVIIWTCATEKYARRALGHVGSAFWHHIVSRDARWYTDGQPAVKDLRWLGRDMDKVLQVDNCPVAVSASPDNCVVVQDIPECLPGIDDTLRLVAEVVAHVVMTAEPVPDGLACCPYVSTTAFRVADEAELEAATDCVCYDINSDDDAGGSSGTTALTTPNTGSSGHQFPEAGDVSCSDDSVQDPGAIIVARSLDYAIPAVVATFGAREQPTVRDRKPRRR